MTVLVNVECQSGTPEPLDHIDWLVSKLQTGTNCVHLCRKFDIAWFYIIEDVSKEVYNTNIDEIEVYFRELFNRLYIQYFFIGEIN